MLPSEEHYTEETVYLVACALVVAHEGWRFIGDPGDEAHLWYDEARAVLDKLAEADLLRPPVIEGPPAGYQTPEPEAPETWPEVDQPPKSRRLRIVR